MGRISFQDENPRHLLVRNREKTSGIFEKNGADMLFDYAAAKYMDDKRKRLRRNTMEGYESALKCHLIPRWKGVELETITPEEIQGWIDGFEMPGAAEKAYKTLRQIIRWAIRRLGLRMYDPTATGIELPRKNPYRPKLLDAGGAAEFLRALWGHECEAVAICAVTLGLRRGEACGLKWSDIDLRTGEVRIARSRQVVRGEEVIEAPKTEKSVRSCWLPKFAVRRLRKLKGKGWLCDLTPDRIARRIASACKRRNVPCVSMTNLRHTWATLAVEAGVGIETIAMMLGHTDISTAYAHYIVPRATICKDAQKQIEALLMHV